MVKSGASGISREPSKRESMTFKKNVSQSFDLFTG
jgi:hypothetical protein